jgi:hypothetical protein
MLTAIQANATLDDVATQQGTYPQWNLVSEVGEVESGTLDRIALAGEALTAVGILRRIRTCDNGDIVVLEKPIKPVTGVPPEDINRVPGLEDYCWKNILGVMLKEAPYLLESTMLFGMDAVALFAAPNNNLTVGGWREAKRQDAKMADLTFDGIWQPLDIHVPRPHADCTAVLPFHLRCTQFFLPTIDSANSILKDYRELASLLCSALSLSLTMAYCGE